MNRINLTAAVGYRGHLIDAEAPDEIYVIYGLKPDGVPYELEVATAFPDAVRWVDRHIHHMQDTPGSFAHRM